jgi:hypothetical protein
VPDQLEVLFADLRAETLPQVRPPGTAAARHTVRRRRTTRNVAAATVALAVAGGLVATRLPHAEPPPVSPAERMAGLVGSARLALDDQLPKLAGRLTTGPVETEKTVAFVGLRPGGYTVAVTCAGAGTIALDIEQTRSAAESAVYGRHTVSCAERPVVAVMTFRITDSDPVVLTATGDAQAAGDAGFALELGDGDGIAN